MSVSKKQAQKLGKRLRDGGRQPSDIDMLIEFRSGYDEILFKTSQDLRQLMLKMKIFGVIAGRTKRIKSILRKIARPENRKMDLSRMSDLVGLRVVVDDLSTQAILQEKICNNLNVVKKYNYLSDAAEYRAIHLICSMENGQSIELQLRTCAQHLWAEESESFGEDVKEGGGSKVFREYLALLSKACFKLDNGSEVSEPEIVNGLMSARKPLSGKYPMLLDRFEEFKTDEAEQLSPKVFMVIFDGSTNELIKIDQYPWLKRDEALREYKRLASVLDESRYDVLFLNSGSQSALAITHSRYVPYFII